MFLNNDTFMKIAFFGQKGVPSLVSGASRNITADAETRAFVLGRALAKDSHEVIITGTHPYIKKDTKDNRVTTLYTPSCNPNHPGGWLYLLLSFLRIAYQQPSVIHVQGWQAAIIVVAGAWLLPTDTTLTLTIDTLPKSFYANISARLAELFDAVTVSTHSLQYQLLSLYNIRTQYIPDGYTPPLLPSIKPSRYGLKRGLYGVALTNTIESLQAVSNAYASIHSRKKLVIIGIQPSQAKQAYLQKKYPFLYFPPQSTTPRALYSIMQAAAFTVFADDLTPLHHLLLVMDAETPIITINHPPYQETLGTHGTYYHKDQIDDLAPTIRKALNKSSKLTEQATQARIRAQKHFQWHRIAPEYTSLYAYKRQAVPIDSVKSPLVVEIAS